MKTILAILFCSAILDLILIIILFINRAEAKVVSGKSLHNFYKFIVETDKASLSKEIRRDRKTFLLKILKISDKLVIPRIQMNILLEVIDETGTGAYIFKLIRSRSIYKRKEGAHLLSILHLPGAGETLIGAFKSEKLFSVKLVFVNAFIEIGIKNAFPVIIDSLVGAPEKYKTKVTRIIQDYDLEIDPYIPDLLNREEIEIKQFLINYSSGGTGFTFLDFLKKQVTSGNTELSRTAFDALMKNYSRQVSSVQFLEHTDMIIKRKALEALGNEKGEHTAIIIKFLDDPDLYNTAVVSLTNMIKNHPSILNVLLDEFAASDSNSCRKGIAKVISNRIEYFLFRIMSREKMKIKSFLILAMKEGYLSGIISFLNDNYDVEIENEILDSVRTVLEENPELREEFQHYLSPRLLEKLGMVSLPADVSASSRKGDVPKVLLVALLIPVFAIFPLIFFLNTGGGVIGYSVFELGKIFLIKSNYYFAYYSFLINGVYLLLLILSFFGIRKIGKNRMIKPDNFLMKEGILPSISIIAPAYGEEATIIENITSLLNLEYPDYEVIVVNDGSKDKTLSVVIEHYELEKVDLVYEKVLAVNKIKGIYRSRNFPKLTLVDKRNGGKADSLNAGINIARGKYCCGIDADSLLESSSLLEAAGLILDEEHEIAAIGGMIIPVNGSSIERGQITKAESGRKLIPGFQTIEYFRAFTAGRIGWSELKSMLIISGAFGIFKKDWLIEVHGYLTSSEHYKRDTVGEDMELVVRLVRFLKEKKEKFKIGYSPFAICWTEVPESLKILGSQRDRWQRGLIEILHMHRKMIFNPRYGNYGKVALPYFLIFETIGPWIELQGYIFFFLALVFRLLSPAVILLVFVAAIFFGIFISLGSLFVTERIRNFFPSRDLWFLIGLAVLENFGFRQIMSFTRIRGYLGLLRKKQGWGEMKRRGFISGEKK